MSNIKLFEDVIEVILITKNLIAIPFLKNNIWELLNKLSKDIAYWQIDVMVALSPDALVISSMLKAKIGIDCSVYNCERTKINTTTSITHPDHQLVQIDDGSSFSIPISLFNLDKKSNIVLVDDFLLNGIPAGYLKRLLKENGFENIKYITLVEFDTRYGQGRIVPDVVGGKFKGMNLQEVGITFPWKDNEKN
jgi:adenine/guanine phosphoribosyltransferase-like PRPP-binding protein